jgi:predicted HAD superfamily hydrolase
MTGTPPKFAEDIETVSFDVLDTLLHRLVSAPVDLFDAVRCKLMTHPGALVEQDSIANFPHNRRLAERRAREVRVESCGGEGEVTYAEIYVQFQRLTQASDACLELLKGAELELEALFLYRSEVGFACYQQAINAGKRVLFISDIYLPQEFLIQNLRRFGFEAANPETVFVSGEERMSKHTGALYGHVQRKMQLSVNKWIHVGDNPHADVKQARRRGLHALLADWSFVRNVPSLNQAFADGLARSLMDGLKLPQYRSLYNPQDRYEYMGYTVFGPLVFGYYAWLVFKLREFQADKILFLGRDGQILHRVHQIITQNSKVAITREADYVYISRKAIYPLGFTGLELNRLHWASFAKSKKTVAMAARDLHLDPHYLACHLEQAGLEPDQDCSNEQQRKRWEHFLRKSFQPLLEMSRKQRESWSGYFTQLVQGANRVAIVDVGWHGNLQANLLRTLNDEWIKRDYKGFYMALAGETRLNMSPYVNMEAWIVNPHEDNSADPKLQSLWNGGCELLEFAFTADHGSTLGYRRNDEGNIEPVLEDKSQNEQHDERCALAVQAGVLEFAKRHAFLFTHFPVEALLSKSWQDNFFRLVGQPMDEQINLFADMTHSDSPGSNANRTPLAKKLNLWHRLTHSRHFKRERNQAYWKRAFELRNHRIFLNRRNLKRVYENRIRPYFRRNVPG